MGELARCGRWDHVVVDCASTADALRMLTLPATLPVIPDRLRVWLLGGLHALRDTTRRQRVPRSFDFDESALVIGAGKEPSLNLVAIART